MSEGRRLAMPGSRAQGEVSPVRWPSVELMGEAPAGAAPLSAPSAPSSAATGRRLDSAELERARQQGLAEGRAETAALRDELAALGRELAAQRRAILDELAGAVVDTALLVIETWLEASEPDRQARLAPVVIRWVREVGAEMAAVAQVAPREVEALRAAVAELPIDLPIEVRADPELLPGDLRLRGERSIIELRWRERLGELREELIAMWREPGRSEP